MDAIVFAVPLCLLKSMRIGAAIWIPNAAVLLQAFKARAVQIAQYDWQCQNKERGTGNVAPKWLPNYHVLDSSQEPIEQWAWAGGAGSLPHYRRQEGDQRATCCSPHPWVSSLPRSCHSCCQQNSKGAMGEGGQGSLGVWGIRSPGPFMTCSMSIERKMFQENFFWLQLWIQSRFNAIICVDKTFAVKNFGVSCNTCMTSVFNLSN